VSVLDNNKNSTEDLKKKLYITDTLNKLSCTEADGILRYLQQQVFGAARIGFGEKSRG
jgi:hypothetical protein